MPFGKWESFDACVKEMQEKEGYDEETAKKVCGRLKAQLENVITRGNAWIEKPVLIESEGLFCYNDNGEASCSKIVKEEMEKTIAYIDSIVVVEGTQHNDPLSLQSVVGKVNDLHIKKINGKWWLAGTGHFNTDKVTGQFLRNLMLNEPISGSVCNWVEITNDTQTEMLPTHFLMHPNLEPNIPGAGVAANTLLFNVKNSKRRKNMAEDIESLKARIAALEKENAELKARIEELLKGKEETVKIKEENTVLRKKVAEIEEAQRKEVQEKLNTAGYSQAELKEMSYAEMRAALTAIERSNDQMRANLMKSQEAQRAELKSALIEAGLTLNEVKDWTLDQMRSAYSIVAKVVPNSANPIVQNSSGRIGGASSDGSSVWDAYAKIKKENITK